jgi:two-component system, sensor histidine kinase and response regulator
MKNSGDLLLIVDDNMLNLQLTAGILKEEGYLISLAQDGQAALSQLGHMLPDLILLDIMMPGIDGLEVCRRLKNDVRLREIPVIFLTAKKETEDLAEGFNVGGVDYITKPFNREELIIRVKNHLELSKSRKKIVEMNRTRDKLYSVIAHDIRSPFSNIVLTLSTLSGGYLDPVSKEFMEIIKNLEKSANETRILIDNLLDWTGLQSDTVILDTKMNSIYGVVDHCLHLLQGNLETKNIKVTLDIPADLTAFFDERSMKSVFRNIIYNAVKFTPSNGEISISGRIQSDNVIVSIIDTGVGMSPDLVKRIFIDNEHYSTPGTENEQGSGLGTFIIKDFVEKNGGTIEVKSIPNSGTIISVYLKSDIAE